MKNMKSTQMNPFADSIDTFTGINKIAFSIKECIKDGCENDHRHFHGMKICDNESKEMVRRHGGFGTIDWLPESSNK